MANETLRVAAPELRSTLAARLAGAGLAAGMAEATAEILTEADLMGHVTHGAALMPVYLDCLASGALARSGSPTVLSQRGAAALWDGHHLAGAWLTLRAIAAAEDMARIHGTGTVVIRRSFHIACLAAYLEAVASRGFVLLLQTSAAHVASVAPHGAKTPVLSPSPLAIGYPTRGAPVLIDISTSTTANGTVRRAASRGEKLPGPWLVGVDGRPTDDPAAGEVILPLGGIDAGHKGFGLGLMVEALTAGLAGFGRADEITPMGGTVFVQVLDPEAFGGLDALSAVMGHVGELCHAAEPIDPETPVRLPGEAALARKAAQLRDGVEIDAGLWRRLQAPG